MLLFFKAEIAEFIPSAKPRLLRLWLAMTNEGPLAKMAKRLFSDLLGFDLVVTAVNALHAI